MVTDVATMFNPLTENLALFLLHLEVFSQLSEKVPDGPIMLSYGLFIEGTTV